MHHSEDVKRLLSVRTKNKRERILGKGAQRTTLHTIVFSFPYDHMQHTQQSENTRTENLKTSTGRVTRTKVLCTQLHDLKTNHPHLHDQRFFCVTQLNYEYHHKFWKIATWIPWHFISKSENVKCHFPEKCQCPVSLSEVSLIVFLLIRSSLFNKTKRFIFPGAALVMALCREDHHSGCLSDAAQKLARCKSLANRPTQCTVW